LDGIPENHHNVITKMLYEDIEKKKASGKLNLEDKKANREYYKTFVQNISNKLSEKI
jgi:hypothetical protein